MTETIISARRLANRAAKRAKDENRFAACIAALNPTEVEYEIESKGRKVRVTPVTDAEIGYFLRGNRVVDTIDLWEGIGQQATTNLINNGSLVRDPNFNRNAACNFYWVTTRAAELYGITKSFPIAGGNAKLIEA